MKETRKLYWMEIKLDIEFETKEFNKAFKQYVKLNKRATSGLVEHTARKVVTGFSPRSPSQKKVKGLRQFFYDKRATKGKIHGEYIKRRAAKIGTLRPPFHYVSKKAMATVKYRTTAQAINWRKRRGSAWLQSTMLYPQWRPTMQGKIKILKPNPRKHKGSPPPTKVFINTKGNKPYVLWESSVPGVVSGKYTKSAIARALKDARMDMDVYIKRKLMKLPFTANPVRI